MTRWTSVLRVRPLQFGIVPVGPLQDDEEEPDGPAGSLEENRIPSGVINRVEDGFAGAPMCLAIPTSGENQRGADMLLLWVGVPGGSISPPPVWRREAEWQ